MTTYVNTPASEIFGGFKGPKMDSLHFTFHFFHLTRNQREESLRDLFSLGFATGLIVPRGQVAPRKPIGLLTRTKSSCSDDHLCEHSRLRNFRRI